MWKIKILLKHEIILIWMLYNFFLWVIVQNKKDTKGKLLGDIACGMPLR